MTMDNSNEPECHMNFEPPSKKIYRKVSDKDDDSDEVIALGNKFNKTLQLEQEAQSGVIPNEELTQAELDALTAHDLHTLTSDERDHVLQDVHGVSSNNLESPEIIAAAKTQLEQQIETLLQANVKAETEAFAQAWSHDPDYVRSLQLSFLRSEDFSVDRAVERIIAFFHRKKELFGKKALTRNITLADFSKDDRKCLEAGSFQLLSVRDSTGRAVLVAAPQLWRYRDIENLVSSYLFPSFQRDIPCTSHHSI